MSAAAIGTKPHFHAAPGSSSRTTQPICTSTSPAAYRRAVVLAAPVSLRAARSHWSVRTTRMIR